MEQGGGGWGPHPLAHGGDAIAAAPRTGPRRISCLRSPSIPGNAVSRGQEGRARRRRRQPQSPVRGAATPGPSEQSGAEQSGARASRRRRARAAVTAAAAAPRAGARSRDGAGWLGRARPLRAGHRTARQRTERHRTARQRTERHRTGQNGTAENGTAQQGRTAPHPRHGTALRTPLSVTSVLSPAGPAPPSGETLRPRGGRGTGRRRRRSLWVTQRGRTLWELRRRKERRAAGAPRGWDRRAGGAPRSGPAPEGSPQLLLQDGLHTCPPRPHVPFSSAECHVKRKT